MTKQDVKTALEAKGAVKVTYADPQTNAGAEVHRIFYRVPKSAEVDSEPKHFDLVKQDDGTYKYQGEIPPILRDTPTVTPARGFILPESTVISKIEAHYTAENSGSWNGEVFEDSIEMRRINSRDQIFVDIVNHSKAVEKRKEFIVSQTNAPDWVQPTGAHDAYDEIGELVTHNGKVWENTHGAGNSWEPGGTGIADTIWKEVDAVKMRPVQ